MRIQDSKFKGMLVRTLAIISNKIDLVINCQIVFDKGKDGGKFCGCFTCKYMEGVMYKYSRDAKTWDEAVRDFWMLLTLINAVYELTLTGEFAPLPKELKHLEATIPQWVEIMRDANPSKYEEVLRNERKRHFQRN